MSRALYRKYRSKTLDEVIGQRHITDILARAIASGHVSHAYLLTGPRGVGKTSVARILAHEINGLKYDEEKLHLDIIEIDAASNNGVEDVRDLREKVQIAPVSAKKKVYIIDEVHMLSKAAFNALLKTLEEPPEHVIFILATTNVEKLPATIISRTQRFSFRPIAVEDVINHLKYIAKEEKIKISDDALELIAKRGEGSFRDSISLLDQISDLTGKDNVEITPELVEEMLGLAPHKVIDSLLDSLENHDIDAVVKTLNRSENEGVSASLIAKQLTSKISELVAEKPLLLSLLDGLIDVDKSSHPQLKLLSVLGTFAATKPPVKSAALTARTREVSASVKKLKKLGTGKSEMENRKFQVSVTMSSQVEQSSRRVVAFGDTLEPETQQTSRLSRVLSSNLEVENKMRATSHSDDTTKDTLEPEADKASGPLSDPARSSVLNSVSWNGDQNNSPIDFNWNKFIDHARQDYVAIHSVLSKCDHEIDGDTLVIYTKNRFYKNKLDEPKHAVLISKCLNEVGVFGLTIHTIPTAVPPKDDIAAAIVAIMGGGEEVAFDLA